MAGDLGELSALPSGTEKPPLERSTSLSTYPKDTNKLAKTGRQKTIGGHGHMQRQYSCLRSEDDQRLLKQSRSVNTYELSQDLQDKQLEMLERKYGGHYRTRRAATTIQQAFRKYSMNKNFEKLRHSKAEKRISRHFSEYRRSATVWNDGDEDLGNGLDRSGMGKEHSPHHLGQTRQLDRAHTIEGAYHSRTGNVKFTIGGSDPDGKSRKLQRSIGIDIEENKTDRLSLSEKNNNRNSYPELNDSSTSESPHGSPIETAEDLHSVNFENLLESRETDILNDSFQSDGSQDSGTGTVVSVEGTQPHAQTHLQTKPQRGKRGPPPPPPPRSDSYNYSPYMQKCLANKDNNVTYENLKGHHSESDASIPSDVQIKVDYASPTDEQTGDQKYANQEVKLRNRKCMSDSALGVHVNKPSPDASPVWKRKSAQASTSSYSLKSDMKRMSNISENSEPDTVSEEQMRYSTSSQSGSDTASIGSNSLGSDFSGYQRSMENLGYQRSARVSMESPQMLLPPRISDKQRKREYRVGLNLFNKKPEKGIFFLVQRCFIEDSPPAVAKFLITRKGLSKQMIGEYLGNLQLAFNMEVLDYFVDEIDLSGLQVDVALRTFQTYFRMPGEAQKIERLMEAFAHRYCICNPDQIKKFKSTDTVFLLAFAIIMLNTDLHNKSIKQERKMKPDGFVKNLRGIDDGNDIDRDLLYGIYDRIRQQEFKAGVDHVMQVMKVEQSVVGKRPLALPHRRLVCYCRLYEVNDPTKKEKIGLHQREIFLFNDLLLVTKVFSKKKGYITYSYRQQFMLCGMQVYLFDTAHYQYGVRLTNHIDGKVLITFNARNEHDRTKFVDDLKECILEMNEMEALRIEEELQKQKHTQKQLELNRISSDSGVVDVDLLRPLDTTCNRLSAPECGGLKKSALSNSLIDLSETTNLKPARRGSGGSLDSGMGMLQASTTSVGTASSQDVASQVEKKCQQINTPVKVSGPHNKKVKTKGQMRLSQSVGEASDV